MPASKKPTLRKLAVYACGAALALAGEALRVWACGHLRKNQAVVRSGPYAHVKNPLYLGTFLILVGLVLAASRPEAGSKNRLLLTVLLPFVLGVYIFYYLPHKFRVEGDRLRRVFGGEYDEYARRVPDFIPSPWPRVAAAGSWSAEAFRNNHEVGWAVAIPLVLFVIASRFFFELNWLR